MNLDTITIDPAILNKAKAKLLEDAERQTYIYTCVEANLCPVCGGRLKKGYNDKSEYEVVCISDSDHYHTKQINCD